MDFKIVDLSNYNKKICCKACSICHPDGGHFLWYETAEKIQTKYTCSKKNLSISHNCILALKNNGKKLIDKKEREFKKDLKRCRIKNDIKWVQLVYKNGTKEDKISAAAILVHTSAVSNIRSLDLLLKVVYKRTRNRIMVHLKVLKVIKELFLTSLLPNRKIHYLDRQLLTLDIACQNDISDKLLLYLYFEDCLKRRFKKFLELLKTCSVDGEDYIKEASINTLYHLLINKPEQEKAILSLIINKIKDPNRKIASKTCYLMTCLIIKHPKMQSVILSEVGKLIILSNSSLRSKIYATILLNQMVLTYVSKRIELTHILMNLYLTGLDKIFKDKFGDTKMIITYNNHKSTKLYWKLIHELLMGVNRVFPFVSDFNSKMWISRNITNLIFIVRSDSYNTGSQALLMLYKFSVLYDEFSHRLYAVLYDVLRYKSMIRVTNSNIIFSILFKMIKKDLLSKRVEAFVKRMLEVALVISTTLAGVILVIISKLTRIHKVIWKNIFQLDKRHIEHKFIKEFTPNQNLKGFVALFIRSKSTNEKKLGMRTIMQFLTQSLHEVNYDQTKLTAIYSKTKFSCFWELLLIANHVHPKIAAMSRIILDGKTISLQHFDSRY